MPTIKIPITTDFIELNQLLKLAGLASSGGGGKALVAAGGITVDGAERKAFWALGTRAGGEVVRGLD